MSDERHVPSKELYAPENVVAYLRSIASQSIAGKQYAHAADEIERWKKRADELFESQAGDELRAWALSRLSHEPPAVTIDSSRVAQPVERREVLSSPAGCDPTSSGQGVGSNPTAGRPLTAVYSETGLREFIAEHFPHLELRAAPPPRESPWVLCSERMPESAVPVLAFVTNEMGKTRRIRAHWCAKFTEESDGDDAEYCEAKDAYYSPEGWYETNEYDDVNWFVHDPVSHWMPLPEGPTATKRNSL